MKYLIFVLLLSSSASAQNVEGPGKFLIGSPPFWKSLVFWAKKDSVASLTFKFPVSGLDTISNNNKIKLHLTSGEILHFTHSGKENYTTESHSHLFAVIKLSENDIRKIMASRVRMASFEARYQETVMLIPEEPAGIINEELKFLIKGQ